MTEQEMMMEILGRFSSNSLYVSTLPNGNGYVEACLNIGYGVSVEFDKDGRVVDMEAFD